MGINSGLIGNAGKAHKLLGIEEEKNVLARVVQQVKYDSKTGLVTETLLQTELDNDIGVGKTVVNKEDTYFVVTFSDTGRQYKVHKDGAVKLADGSEDIHVKGIILNKPSTSLKVGETETLIATINPPDAENKNVTWSSDRTSVATVDTSGKVTGVAAGSATITARTQDGNYTATCTVTVTVPATGISLNKSSTSLVVGGTETLIATVNPSGATNKTVTWSSNSTSVATVNTSGKVTGVAAGSATITARTQDGNYSATCTVTVTVPVTGINLNKSSTNLVVGGTETLIAIVNPSGATNKTVTWSSDGTSVATVNTSGKVTGVAGGSATITARTQDGNYTATCTVTVTVPVTGVSLNRTSASIDVGSTLALTKTIIPSNATNQNVTWSSDDTNIATVTSTGVVRGVAGGSTTITVTTVDGGYTATCNVTIISNVVPVIVTNAFYAKTTNSITINAKATDEDGDYLTYKLYTNTSSSGIFTLQSTSASTLQNTQVTLTANSLSEYVTYYWYITVTDDDSAATSGKQNVTTFCSGTNLTCTTSLCSSSTIIVCPSCNGTKKITCTTCNGTGYYASGCNGTTTLTYVLPTTCTYCGGAQEARCLVCQTCSQIAGVSTFQACTGCGREVPALAYVTPHNVRCKKCSGIGRMTCPTCSDGVVHYNPCTAHNVEGPHRYCAHYTNTTLTTHKYCSHGNTSQHD